MTRSADGQHVPAPSPGPSLSAYAAGLPEVSRLIRQRIESGPGGTGASRPVPANSATGSGDTEAGATADILPAVAVAASVPVAAVTITWADGTVTTVHPPEAPARPVNATPAHWPRGLPGGHGSWADAVGRNAKAELGKSRRSVRKLSISVRQAGTRDPLLTRHRQTIAERRLVSLNRPFDCSDESVVSRQLNVCVFTPFWHARDTAGMALARMGLL